MNNLADEKDGPGILIIPGRQLFLAHWKKNNMHGNVIRFDSNGSRVEYCCKEGKEHGKWKILTQEAEKF